MTSLPRAGGALLLCVAALLSGGASSAAAAGPDPFVPQSLLDAATAQPSQLFRVIVQGQPASMSPVVEASVDTTIAALPATGDGISNVFGSISGVAAELTGDQILMLAQSPGVLAITSDVPLRATAADPPAALEPPALTGASQVGAQMSATTGQWAGAEPLAYDYRWERCDATANCVEVANAVDPVYDVTSEDVGSTLAVVVSASNADGSATSTSAPSAPVAPAPAPPLPILPPSALVDPSVEGAEIVGQTLVAANGEWIGGVIAFTRQWQRCSPLGDLCADIDGATGPEYTLSADDLNATVRVVVTATDAFGETAVASAPTDVVVQAALGPVPSGSPSAPTTVLVDPRIRGRAVVGERLEVRDGAWSGDSLSFAWQWQRCSGTGDGCADIPRATRSRYELQSADARKTVRVVITVTAPSGTTTYTSPVTDVVADAPLSGGSGSDGSGDGGSTTRPIPLNTSLPTVAGSVVADSTLTASPGTWTTKEPPLRYGYAWERCPADGGPCATVAAGKTYLLTRADIGSRMNVVVTASDDEHGTASARSADGSRIAPHSASGLWNWHLGPYAAGLDGQWSAVTSAAATAPAIAIVDSGVDAATPGLAGAVVRQIDLTTLPQSDEADGYGHGSFVAGVAAGRGAGESGAAPTAPIVSLDVMDDSGMALTSDVIAAADWIDAHKTEDGIRVANFSLTGSSPSSVLFDPLDRALERLWLSGVVVVTAAGNYGVDGAAGTVAYAPANDPFAITVGASDPAGSTTTADDFAAPWSVYGHTFDGFAKPELGAPGRGVVAALPTGSGLYRGRPDRIVGKGQLQLSGTSFAAPLVSGAAANLLALHPGWSPDQVKGALMVSAAQPGAAAPFSLGVGVLDATAAAAVADPPNPNAALEQFVVGDPASGAAPAFDAASWGTAAQADASWGTASWGTASWGTASWGTASWGTDYWSAASWGTASWGTASWGTASWGTVTAAQDNAAADVAPADQSVMRWP